MLKKGKCLFKRVYNSNVRSLASARFAEETNPKPRDPSPPSNPKNNRSCLWSARPSHKSHPQWWPHSHEPRTILSLRPCGYDADLFRQLEAEEGPCRGYCAILSNEDWTETAQRNRQNRRRLPRESGHSGSRRISEEHFADRNGKFEKKLSLKTGIYQV